MLEGHYIQTAAAMCAGCLGGSRRLRKPSRNDSDHQKTLRCGRSCEAQPYRQPYQLLRMRAGLLLRVGTTLQKRKAYQTRSQTQQQVDSSFTTFFAHAQVNRAPCNKVSTWHGRCTDTCLICRPHVSSKYHFAHRDLMALCAIAMGSEIYAQDSTFAGLTFMPNPMTCSPLSGCACASGAGAERNAQDFLGADCYSGLPLHFPALPRAGAAELQRRGIGELPGAEQWDQRPSS